jgi:hypothetical protein
METDMTKREHLDRVFAGDIRPRVVEHNWKYVAWTPTKEGPARPDYAAAYADLQDMLRI